MKRQFIEIRRFPAAERITRSIPADKSSKIDIASTATTIEQQNTVQLAVPPTARFTHRTPVLAPLSPAIYQDIRLMVENPIQPLALYMSPTMVNHARKKSRLPFWARMLFVVLLLLLLLFGAASWYYYSNLAEPLSHITGQAVPRFQDDVPPAQQHNPTTTPLSGRVNILLLGSDTDSKFLFPLAQTDIILTIDPHTHYVGMLSLPRDLWIPVPGHAMQKLDQAFADGWRDTQSFDGAVRLSLETIHRVFGIYIDHYAWVGLDGFIKVIDTAGGVDIDTIHPILDDTYPDDINTGNAHGYKRLSIAPGPQHLTGMTALEYVRSRHADLVGDFGRSARQQQILNQLKTKLDLPNTLSKLPAFVNDLNGYVKTDMQLPDILSLVNFARTINPSTVDHAILSPPYASNFVTSDGQDALRPNCTLIASVLTRMFATNPDTICDTLAATRSFTPVSPIARTLTSHAFMGSGMSFIPTITQSTLQIDPGSNILTGIHDLLDLLFLTTCESFDALKV